MEEFDIYFEDFDIEEEVARAPKKYLRDGQNPLEFYNDREFKIRFKFSKECVQEILLPLVEARININDRRGLPLNAMQQLLIALRFYASNSFQLVHGDIDRFSQSSTHRAIKNISECFAEHSHEFIKIPETARNLESNKRKFFDISHFPSVLGCIDGTHIKIKNPGGENAEVFRNRKGWMSLNVQVVAGPNLEILDIVARHPGSTHDNVIFERSAVRARLERNDITGILLGDNGYACRRYLLTPYLEPVTPAELNYNNAHKQTRNIVERLFGQWKRRFSCLKSGLRTNIDNTMCIIISCAVLHNIAIAQNQDEINNNEVVDEEVPVEPLVNDAGGLAYRAAFTQQHF